MLKTIPLMKASLKRFLRDWKAIFLLIVFPLLLITVVFMSFNPAGLRKVPVGIIGHSDQLNIEDYKDQLTYLEMTRFNKIEDCILDLKSYNSYVCIEIIDLEYKEGAILNVHYDNTREPIIWEIIERIKSTVDYFQEEISKDMATDFLSVLSDTGNKIDSFKFNLINTHGKIDEYIYEADGSITRLENARTDVEITLDQMDRDIDSVRLAKRHIVDEKDRFSSDSSYYLGFLDSNMYGVDSLRQRINQYDRYLDASLVSIDQRIDSYETMSRKGRQHMNEIDDSIVKLNQVKQELIDYKIQLREVQKELDEIQSRFRDYKNFDVETLINPIVINNRPVFVSYFNQDEKVAESFNLMSLQTIFPMILLLIVLFISLLISSFMCLKDINSSANKRIRLIKGVFFPEIFSVYFSSFVVIFVPLFCVLALGDFIFKIPIFYNSDKIFVLIFLLTSCFILMGMIFAYLIKKESITLLISTFMLVFLIFFSGFLLPIERMSYFSAVLASNFPGKIALTAFSKVVFYNAGFVHIGYDLLSLGIWVWCLFVLVVLVKKWKRR